MQSDPPNADPAIDLDPRPEPGWRTEPPVLRRIDWLVVAPWTVLLRVPSLALGLAPFLAGVWCLLLFDGYADSAATLSPESIAGEAFHAARLGNLSSPVLRDSLIGSLETVLGAIVFAYAVCAALRWAATRCCAGLAQVSTKSSYAFALRRSHRAILALLLVLAPGIVVLGLGRLLGGVLATESAGASFVETLLVTPAAYLGALWCLVSLLAAPLMLAAVAVDDADSFDAASRGIAYVVQRPLLALWCAAVTLLMAFAGGLVVETLIAVTQPIGDWMLPDDAAGQEVVANTGPHGTMLITLLRSFYPACWVAGVAGVYLVLRHSVDGQPLDEIAAWKGDQPQ